MDETIGAKGGKNDRRRTLIISEKKKKKLKELEESKEIEYLEQKVKRNQRFVLIKSLPIALGGGFIKTIYDVSKGKKKQDKEEVNSKWRIKEYDGDVSDKTPIEERRKKLKEKIIITPTGEKIIVYINVNELKKDSEKDKDTPIVIDHFIGGIDGNSKKSDNTKTSTEVGVGINIKDDGNNVRFLFQGNPKKTSALEEYVLIEDVERESFKDLGTEEQKTIQKLQSRKIIDAYEDKLKEIRYELRNAIYEYNVLVDDEKDILTSVEAEEILDKLSRIIAKIEELKAKIKVDNLDKYDDNYIYYLIEGYLAEFKDKKFIKEIKDSGLYIMISEKLDELDKKKGSLNKKVEEKKKNLTSKEEAFKKLKEKYLSVDKLNHELFALQNSQDRKLREIQDKVRNAQTITEKVEVEFEGMNHQTRRLLRTLAIQMFFPEPRFARGVAASTALHLYFMNNVMHPKTKTKKYKVITVTDYSDNIKNSIKELDDAISLLGKTSKQIDKIIKDIETTYKDYIGVISGCTEMLINLRRIKSEVEEKEYEMKKLKQKQKLELEKNNAKVLTRGKYPVN